jgi:hypothetical protein
MIKNTNMSGLPPNSLVSKTISAVEVFCENELLIETNTQIRLDTPNLLVNFQPFDQYIRNLVFGADLAYPFDRTTANITQNLVNGAVNITESFNNDGTYEVENVFCSNMDARQSYILNNMCPCISISSSNSIRFGTTTDITYTSNATTLSLGDYIYNILNINRSVKSSVPGIPLVPEFTGTGYDIINFGTFYTNRLITSNIKTSSNVYVNGGIYGQEPIFDIISDSAINLQIYGQTDSNIASNIYIGSGDLNLKDYVYSFLDETSDDFDLVIEPLSGVEISFTLSKFSNIPYGNTFEYDLDFMIIDANSNPPPNFDDFSSNLILRSIRNDNSHSQSEIFHSFGDLTTGQFYDIYCSITNTKTNTVTLYKALESDIPTIPVKERYTLTIDGIRNVSVDSDPVVGLVLKHNWTFGFDEEELTHHISLDSNIQITDGNYSRITVACEIQYMSGETTVFTIPSTIPVSFDDPVLFGNFINYFDNNFGYTPTIDRDGGNINVNDKTNTNTNDVIWAWYINEDKKTNYTLLTIPIPTIPIIPINSMIYSNIFRVESQETSMYGFVKTSSSSLTILFDQPIINTTELPRTTYSNITFDWEVNDIHDSFKEDNQVGVTYLVEYQPLGGLSGDPIVAEITSSPPDESPPDESPYIIDNLSHSIKYNVRVIKEIDIASSIIYIVSAPVEVEMDTPDFENPNIDTTELPRKTMSNITFDWNVNDTHDPFKEGVTYWVEYQPLPLSVLESVLDPIVVQITSSPPESPPESPYIISNLIPDREYNVLVRKQIDLFPIIYKRSEPVVVKTETANFEKPIIDNVTISGDGVASVYEIVIYWSQNVDNDDYPGTNKSVEYDIKIESDEVEIVYRCIIENSPFSSSSHGRWSPYEGGLVARPINPLQTYSVIVEKRIKINQIVFGTYESDDNVFTLNNPIIDSVNTSATDTSIDVHWTSAPEGDLTDPLTKFYIVYETSTTTPTTVEATHPSHHKINDLSKGTTYTVSVLKNYNSGEWERRSDSVDIFTSYIDTTVNWGSDGNVKLTLYLSNGMAVYQHVFDCVMFHEPIILRTLQHWNTGVQNTRPHARISSVEYEEYEEIHNSYRLSLKKIKESIETLNYIQDLNLKLNDICSYTLVSTNHQIQPYWSTDFIREYYETYTRLMPPTNTVTAIKTILLDIPMDGLESSIESDSIDYRRYDIFLYVKHRNLTVTTDTGYPGTGRLDGEFYRSITWVYTGVKELSATNFHYGRFRSIHFSFQHMKEYLVTNVLEGDIGESGLWNSTRVSCSPLDSEDTFDSLARQISIIPITDLYWDNYKELATWNITNPDDFDVMVINAPDSHGKSSFSYETYRILGMNINS